MPRSSLHVRIVITIVSKNTREINVELSAGAIEPTVSDDKNVLNNGKKCSARR